MAPTQHTDTTLIPPMIKTISLHRLDLLGNPTGLATSVRAGLRDLVMMPLVRAGKGGSLLGRSTEFVRGLGSGSASLVQHVRGREKERKRRREEEEER